MSTPLSRILRAAASALVDSLLPSRTSPARPGTGGRKAGRSTGPDPRTSAPPSSSIPTTVAVSEALAHVSYDPSPDGDADPGEVVWTWIPYEEDDTVGKDRPVVVLGREAGDVFVAQMTSKDHDRDAAQEAKWGRYWMDIGTGPWDPLGRPSEVRLDRVLRVKASTVRREGSTLPRATFEAIVARLGRVAGTRG